MANEKPIERCFTDDEIIHNYRLARKKRLQIRILAQLNCTSETAIVDLLRSANLKVPDANYRSYSYSKLPYDYNAREEPAYLKAVKMLENGETTEDVAKALDLTKEYVGQLRIKYTVNGYVSRRAHSAKRLSQEQIDKILELRKSRLSYHEIAIEVGCAESTVSKQCKKDKELPHNRVSRWNAKTLKELDEMRKSGATVDEISKHYNTAPSNIYYAIRKYFPEKH